VSLESDEMGCDIFHQNFEDVEFIYKITLWQANGFSRKYESEEECKESNTPT